MLVLTFKAGERAMVGEDITVEVLEMRAGQVKLGFVAPLTIEIDRETIRARKRIDRARGAAARALEGSAA